MFFTMLIVASVGYGLRGAYYWHVKSVKAVLSEYPQIENVVIGGEHGLLYSVTQLRFSIAGKPDSRITVDIPYAAPKSRLRSIVDSALADQATDARLRNSEAREEPGAFNFPLKTHNRLLRVKHSGSVRAFR
jgi:hypothetical protein